MSSSRAKGLKWLTTGNWRTVLNRQQWNLLTLAVSWPVHSSRGNKPCNTHTRQWNYPLARLTLYAQWSREVCPALYPVHWPTSTDISLPAHMATLQISVTFAQLSETDTLQVQPQTHTSEHCDVQTAVTFTVMQASYVRCARDRGQLK